ncbi:hypothetical protein ES707_17467 [subsurface metagenome]
MYDISADILKVAMKGARKSHIIYKANLNFLIVKKYLKLLQNAELLTRTGRIYRTTEKGVKYINHFNRLKEYLFSDIMPLLR